MLVGAYVIGLALSITLTETALILLAVRWIVRLARGEARRGWPLVAPIAAFAAVTLAAALHAAMPGDSLLASRTVLLLASVWIVRDALPDARAAERALLLLLGTMVITSFVGIAQVTYCAEWPAAATRAGEAAPWLGRVIPWATRLGTKCHRARGFYSIYMTLGGVLNILLLMTLPLLLRTRGRPRWAPLAWLVSLIAFALTYVRGAWVGFVAGIVLLGAWQRRGRALVLGAAVAFAVVVLLLPGVRARVRSIADPNDPTSSERVLMWRSGLAMARDHPWLGIGPGQVKRVYPGYADERVTNKSRGHLHNSAIQILVERGVPGLVAWLAIFAAFFVRAVRLARGVPDDSRERALVIGAMAGMAGFLVGGLTEHNFGDSEVMLIAMLAMSVVGVVYDA